MSAADIGNSDTIELMPVILNGLSGVCSVMSTALKASLMFFFKNSGYFIFKKPLDAKTAEALALREQLAETLPEYNIRLCYVYSNQNSNIDSNTNYSQEDFQNNQMSEEDLPTNTNISSKSANSVRFFRLTFATITGSNLGNNASGDNETPSLDKVQNTTGTQAEGEALDQFPGVTGRASRSSSGSVSSATALALTRACETFNASIHDVSKKIDDLSKSAGEMKSELGGMKGELGEIKGDLGNLATKVDKMDKNKQVAGTSAGLPNLTFNVNQTTGSVNADSKSSNKLDNAAESSSKVDETTKTITEIRTEADAENKTGVAAKSESKGVFTLTKKAASNIGLSLGFACLGAGLLHVATRYSNGTGLIKNSITSSTSVPENKSAMSSKKKELILLANETQQSIMRAKAEVDKPFFLGPNKELIKEGLEKTDKFQNQTLKTILSEDDSKNS